MLASFARSIGNCIQWLYPKEFRVDHVAAGGGPIEGNAAQLRLELEALRRDCTKAIVETGKGLWQVLTWTIDQNTRGPKTEMLDVYLTVKNLIDDLRSDGIELIDLSGTEYRRGMGVRAMFTTAPHLSVPTILEMEEPQVVWRGRRIHEGKAIVGEPRRLERDS